MVRPIGEGARAGLAPILSDAKANLIANGSVHRGVLLRGLVIRRNKKKLRNSVSWQVAASGKAVSIAHLVEFGTEPHWQPNRGVMHPGAEPKEFLSPAYYDNEREAISIFGKIIGPALEEQAARLYARSRR
ncbi:MAG: hypothetical protein AAF468_20175 [Pseudomonadota bacterium]